MIAFPYGGEGSYWHNRDDGDWGTYVLDEVIPGALATSGADPKRVAIGGISMGGYGALHLAAERPARFCAAGGHSPALWEEAGLSAPGAFDDAEDFEANDVLDEAAAGTYEALPLWIDAGDEDPFIPGIEAMAAALDDRRREPHLRDPARRPRGRLLGAALPGVPAVLRCGPGGLLRASRPRWTDLGAIATKNVL